MARITRPLTNNEILKAKPREKDFTLHDRLSRALRIARHTSSASGEDDTALPTIRREYRSMTSAR